MLGLRPIFRKRLTGADLQGSFVGSGVSGARDIEKALGRVCKLYIFLSVAEKIPLASPLKSARILGVALLPQNFEQDRGTLTDFSPLFKAGAKVRSWGGSKGRENTP